MSYTKYFLLKNINPRSKRRPKANASESEDITMTSHFGLDRYRYQPIFSGRDPKSFFDLFGKNS